MVAHCSLFQAVHDELRMALNFALDCGYRSIDTAHMYLNEEVIGDVLQDWFKKGKLKREDVFVTSKVSLKHKRL